MYIKSPSDEKLPPTPIKEDPGISASYSTQSKVLYPTVLLLHANPFIVRRLKIAKEINVPQAPGEKESSWTARCFP